LLDNLLHASPWPWPKTLSPISPEVLRMGQVEDVRATQTETSGGSSETDVKELAAIPTGAPSAPDAASASTPLGKQENAGLSISRSTVEEFRSRALADTARTSPDLARISFPALPSGAL
jgi:hypothetical protein